MIWVARIAGALVMLFSFVLGLSALVNPERAAETLGLAPISDMGRNSIRADIVAFAWASTILSVAGLFAGRGRWFVGAAVLFGMAATGRIIDSIVAGMPEGAGPAIIVELIVAGLALVAAKWLPSKA